jgi:curved DNA-binding protein CbpA
MIGMRGIDELDHYEMLEVARSASPGEIDRAYRMAQETWADGSLALYSIFEKRDASEIRARLDEAYRVLADAELRASYDLSHHAVGGAVGAVSASPAEALASKALNGARAKELNGARAAVTASSPRMDDAVDVATAGGFDDGVEGYEPEEDSSGEFDGPRLRRTRLFRGYEIEQIADVTKIASLHLRNIEDENYVELPADVYVRGFVTAYAKTIGLDPQAVVPSYMARLQESRQTSQKSRFLGLR